MARWGMSSIVVLLPEELSTRFNGCPMEMIGYWHDDASQEREGTGISVVGLHHGELVCTVRPHISPKVMMSSTVPYEAIGMCAVLSLRSLLYLGGDFLSGWSLNDTAWGPMWLDGRPRW
ncbi:unnamed protein product [Rhizophagus irregularis]|nr:unnamed protein product [Rhizophagus irregularis]